MLVKLNGQRVKALFIRGKPGMCIQEIIRIGKAEARKIGMGYVDVLDVVWSENSGGWSVIVQSTN